MRVTFASYDDDPPIGGQGVELCGMRAALEARGIRTHTVAGRGRSAIRYPRIVGRAPLDFSIHLNRHPDLLGRGDPQVVHALGGPGGALLVRRLWVPLVYTANHTYRQAYGRLSPRRTLALMEAASLRRAAMVLPISPSTADAVMALGIPRERIEVVPPGVAIPETPAAPRVDQRILFVGRQEPEKGVVDALTAMRALLVDYPAATARVVGVGSLAPLATAAAQREDRLEYLGAIDAAELARQYAEAAVVLMPSRYEGLGLVALEAMAAGAVVVGYSVDGLRDAVGPGGILVHSGDVVGLEAAVSRLLDDVAFRNDLADAGRQHVSRHYSWRATGQRLEQIYRAVVAA